jgi:hypothetical protein
MFRAIGLAVAGIIAVMSLTVAGTAIADDKPASARQHANSAKVKGGAKVKGYVARRGGYSYSAEDTINTYGDSRSRYGATQSFRDPMMDRQSSAGPFDHGFFFESGIAPRGGNSPYMN